MRHEPSQIFSTENGDWHGTEMIGYLTWPEKHHLVGGASRELPPYMQKAVKFKFKPLQSANLLGLYDIYTKSL